MISEDGNLRSTHAAPLNKPGLGANPGNHATHPTEQAEGQTMPVAGAGQEIYTAVTSWTEITHRPHRFGGVEFRLGHREVGHVHGDSLVDIPFPKAVRDELVASAAAEPHHILPKSGWVSVYLRDAGDVGRAIRLLRRSYEIALASLRNAATA